MADSREFDLTLFVVFVCQLVQGGQTNITRETPNMVYEGGLDKRSSLDSIQQALFASHVTGKRLGAVIYNTDGKEGRFEYRIKTACEKVGVVYRIYP